MLALVKKIRYWVRNVFGFSQTETTGFLTLTLLMLLWLFAAILVKIFWPASGDSYTSDAAKLDSLMVEIEKASKDRKFKDKPAAPSIQPAFLTDFDPNLIGIEQWQAFGLPTYMAERIHKYKQKGGKFKVKKDLLKIYGFPQPLYEQLYAYIQLPDSIIHDNKIEKHAYIFTKEPSAGKELPAKYEKKEAKFSRFNLNTADTTQLKLIKGIGPALSKRIIKYRDLLGGFATPEQIREVYGLDSTVVDELLKYGYLPENALFRKIKINSATLEELDAHPYISPKVAKVLVAYRQQHGNFTSIESIYEIRVIDQLTLTKLTPYISLE